MGHVSPKEVLLPKNGGSAIFAAVYRRDALPVFSNVYSTVISERRTIIELFKELESRFEDAARVSDHMDLPSGSPSRSVLS